MSEPSVIRHSAPVSASAYRALQAERDALAAEVERLRAAVKTVDDQRRYAERCVGSLPLEMGEHFERRKAETDAFVRALTEEDDRG